MPITSCTIDGVEFDALFESFDIRESAGAVSTLSLDVASLGSPVLRPELRQEIIVQEDGVKIFAGHLTQVRERGFGAPNLYSDSGAPQIVTTVTAEDYNRLAERRVITETVAAGTTLEAFLTTLVTYFSTYGVTLHGSQATGPNLPAMSFDLVRGTEILEALSDATGYTWRIDYDKKLRMWAPGEQLAPFDIDEDDLPAKWTGDVEVERILGDDYANRVIVVSDPIDEEFHIQTFVGDGVTDTFDLDFTFIELKWGLIHRFESDGVTPDGGETIGLVGTTPAQWELDPVTNSITRLIGATPADKVYKLTYHGTFQAEAMAEDAADIAAYGLTEHIERRNDITTDAAAQTLADAILAERLNAGDLIVRYKTRQTAPTLRVGQQQEITALARDISGEHLITEMQVVAETPVTTAYATSGLGFIRTITAKRQQLTQGRWQLTYHDWLLVGQGGSASTPGAGPSVASGPAPPFYSVQFNRQGQFGGDADFTYYEATNSVACGGGGTSIDAANPESCQAFGYNCHIGDSGSPGGGSEYWELLASTTKQSPGGGVVTTDPIDTTGADLILVHVAGWFGEPVVSDSEGNAWTGGPGSSSSVTNKLSFVFTPDTAFAHTFTATGGNYPSISVLAFRGGVSADTANQQSSSSAGATSLTAGPTAPNPPSANNHLVISTLALNVGSTPSVAGTNVTLTLEESSGWTATQAMNSNIAWGIQTTAAVVTAQWSAFSSSECAASIVTFAPGDALFDEVRGSLVAGLNTDVNATLSMALGLDGNPHVHTEPNKLKVYGRGEFTEDLIVIDPVNPQDAVPKHYCDSNAGGPVGASYVTLATNATLTSERVLTGSGRISVTDAGAGTTVTLDIPDAGVTNAKLVDMAQATIKGRAAGAGTGDQTDLTPDQVSTLLDSATDPFVRTSAGGGGGISTSTGTYASLPAAGNAGDLYIPNDSYYDMLRDTGSVWEAFRSGQKLTLPVSGDFSWVNQGSATVDTTFGATFLYVPKQGSLNARIRVKTAPSTPYVITAAFIIQHSRQNSSGIGSGLCWRETGTGELITWGPVSGNTLPNWEYALIKMNSPSSYNSEYGSGGEGRVRQPMLSVIWLRFEDNGTNRRTWLSDDGRYWREYLSATSRTDFLTADQVGFYCDTTDPNLDTGVAVIHWKET